MTTANALTTRQINAAERKASRARIEQAQSETRAAVVTGTCPCCGGKVYRNMSLTGWWQCGAYGSDGFARDGKTAAQRPNCSWQGFTE